MAHNINKFDIPDLKFAFAPFIGSSAPLLALLLTILRSIAENPILSTCTGVFAVHTGSHALWLRGQSYKPESHNL